MVSRRGGASTAYDRLAANIRAQILSGELSPGDQLPTEQDLSGHYEVSRNTAREALRVLASQGLLTVKRGVSGGTFVAFPTPDQISESLETGLSLLARGAIVPVAALMEIREILEVPAAEMAALRWTEDDLAAIRASFFDPSDVDAATVFSNTGGFHTGLLRAAKNPLLEAFADPMQRVLRDRFLREYAPARFWEKVNRDNREILDNLQARNQAGAGEAMRAHLRRLRWAYEGMDRHVHG